MPGDLKNKLRYAKKLEWTLVLLLGKAVISKIALNHWIRIEIRWNKKLLSIMAWLKRNLATQVEQKFTSRVVDRTERLYSNCKE